MHVIAHRAACEKESHCLNLGLNPQPFDHESNAIITPPHCCLFELHFFGCIVLKVALVKEFENIIVYGKSFL